MALMAAPRGAGARARPGADGRCGPGPYLRRRLIVALVFFVPLSDLSVLLSLFPAYRFPAGNGSWSRWRRRWRGGRRGRSTRRR